MGVGSVYGVDEKVDGGEIKAVRDAESRVEKQAQYSAACLAFASK